MKPHENSLAVVPSKLQPPPSKKEIAGALLERERATYNADRDRRQKVAHDGYQALAMEAKGAVLKGNRGQTIEVTINYKNDVQVIIVVKTPKTDVLLSAYKKALKEVPCPFDEERAKDRINAALLQDRVPQMLADPAVVKALDAMLLKIGSVSL